VESARSAELSFEEELRAIAKETGKPESVEFVEKLIAAGHTPYAAQAATGKAGSTPARSQRSGETGGRFDSGVVDSGEPKARPASGVRLSAESGDQSISTDKDDALEFAARHFEAYGASHMQFGKPWTGIQLAEVIRACIPSAGGAIERCPKCNGDQRGAPCAYPEACGHPCRTYIAERNQALLAAASAGRDRELAEGVLKLTKTVRYLVGIAEVGEGRPMLDDETAEQFVLRYVQRLEQELRALRSHVQPMLDECGQCGRQVVHKNYTPERTSSPDSEGREE